MLDGQAHVGGHGATVDSLLCFSEGTDETVSVLSNAKVLLTRKSQTLARELCYLHTRLVASGYATAESSASHRTLAGSERCKYGCLLSQVRGHSTFRHNSYKNSEVNWWPWSKCL